MTTLSDEIAGGLFSQAASVPQPVNVLTGLDTLRRFKRLTQVMSFSGNPDADFYYLGGPMTGIPQFNFPRFQQVAALLRDDGLNIVSPAELDDPETEKAAMASHDGAPGTGSTNGQSFEDFLSRDIIIVSLPTCIGGIFIDGWHTSRGARGETWVLSYLKKKLYEYTDDPKPMLTPFDRDERLAELGVPSFAAGAVPKDAPGMLTVAANEVVDTSAVHPSTPEPLDLEPLGSTDRVTDRRGALDLGTLHRRPVPRSSTRRWFEGRGHHESDAEFEGRRIAEAYGEAH
jgi:hypothetical protein